MHNFTGGSEAPTIVPQYIKDIVEITLSHREMLALVVIPERSISHARLKMRSAPDRAKTFPYFLKICQSHSSGDYRSLPEGRTFPGKKTFHAEKTVNRKPDPTPHDYTRANLASKKHMLEMISDPEAKKRIALEIVRLENKLSQPEPMARTSVVQTVAERKQHVLDSWRLPLTELGEMKKKCDDVYMDPAMRSILLGFFDINVRRAMGGSDPVVAESVSDNKTIREEKYFHIPEPTHPMTKHFDETEVDSTDDDYQDINTNLLF